jgi:hypothetical protein
MLCFIEVELTMTHGAGAGLAFATDSSGILTNQKD